MTSLNLTAFIFAVDSEMCKLAVSQKFELVKQLGIVLQAEVKPSEHRFCCQVVATTHLVFQ